MRVLLLFNFLVLVQACFANQVNFLESLLDSDTMDIPRIIFDTDIGSDCDDAGALAVLHNLANKQEAKILGVVYSSNANVHGSTACAEINSFFGRPNLLLGEYRGSVVIGDPRDSYTGYLANIYDKANGLHKNERLELVVAYKKMLENQPKKSVTIVTVGHPVGLFYLMCDREGRKLVEEKVKSWVAMTHTDTTPKNDWNFGKNGSDVYISGLLKLWPTAVYFSGAGQDVITGKSLLPKTSIVNPVRHSYELWGNNALKNGRSSWDQIAVLFAIRPQLFDLENGELRQNDDFETFWTDADGDDKVSRNHFKVLPKLKNTELAELIEALMVLEPGN